MTVEERIREGNIMREALGYVPYDPPTHGSLYPRAEFDQEELEEECNKIIHEVFGK